MFASFRFKGYRLPFFLLLMLTFATVIIGDNAAESLLLAQYDATIVAKLFSLNATLLFLFSLFMISFIDRIDRGKLFTRFLFFHISVLLSSWVAVTLGVKAIVIPLFSYAYVSKIFIFLIFWTLANDIVDPRRAARDFPKIAAGGTLGAISISFLIPFIVGKIPAEALLFVWALLASLVLFLFQPIRKQFGRSFLPGVAVHSRISKVKQISGDIKTIGRDPLLKSMAFFYFLLFFVLLNQQYGFYTVLNERYSDAAEISRFLGFFSGTSMAVTFLLQVTLSSVVIRRIGSTRAMLILPVVFTLVFLFLRITQQFDAAAVLFWGTVAGLGLRIAVFDSFYSPNFQIFFSSLPKAIRGRGKISLEGVVKPASMILASLWLTFLMPKLPETAATSILVAASIAMIVLTLKMRKQYTKSLTRYLTDFKNRAANTGKFSSAEVIPQIRELLAEESFEVQCYLIEILADMRSQAARDELKSLLYSVDEALLPKVIEALTPLALPELKPRMRELLRGSDNAVVTAAIRAVAEYNDSPDELLPFLTSPSTILQLTVIELLWWRVTPIQRQSMVKEIEVRLQSSDAEILFATLDLCGKIDDPLATGLIPKRFPNFTDPLLMSHYSWQRFTAAVSDLEGEDILDWILQNSDQRGGPQLKSLIAAVQNIISTGYPIESVLDRLETASLRQRYLLSGGAARWGRSQGGKNRKQIQKLLEREFSEMIVSEKLYTTISQLKSPAGELLATAVEEELLALHRSTATALASMLDRKGEIRQVAHRLNHSDVNIRSRALEVLDNVGDRKLNHRLIHHLTLPKSNAEASSADLFIAIEELEGCSNRWLKECAHFAMSTFPQEVKA